MLLYGSFSGFIASLALVPVVAAAHVWGQSWVRLRVEFLSDNAAVVAILNKGSIKSHDVMQFMGILTRIASRHSFVTTCLVPGLDNRAADSLSCFQVADFLRLSPDACPCSIPISESLLLLLCPPTSYFSAIVFSLSAWPLRLVVPTLLVNVVMVVFACLLY